MKKSRTGKKKRPMYGPRAQQSDAQHLQKTENPAIKKARRSNYISVACLIVALIIILFVGFRYDVQTMAYKGGMTTAYIATLIAGVLMLRSRKHLPEYKSSLNFVPYMMIFVGIFGIFYTLFLASKFDI